MIQGRADDPTTITRRGAARSDNIAVVPASLLYMKSKWQKVANELPDGHALFVVPRHDSPLRRSMVQVAAHWHGRGRHAAAIDADQVGGKPH